MSNENDETLGNCGTNKFELYDTARLNSLLHPAVGENKIRSLLDLRSPIMRPRTLVHHPFMNATLYARSHTPPNVIARQMILTAIGERTMAMIYLPLTLRRGTYLVMKKLNPELCPTGSTINQYFIGLGMDAAMAVFRRAHPVWFNLEMTSKGVMINYNDQLDPSIPILWARTIASYQDFPNAAAWNVADINLFARDESLGTPCLSTIYGAMARSILRTGPFTRDDSMIIMPDGRVLCTKSEYEVYFTACLGQVVRLHVGLLSQYSWSDGRVDEVTRMDPRRSRHNTFDSDVICPYYEFVRETFAQWKVKTDHPITYAADGGRWYITGKNLDLNAQLLMRCGDVESNPGPTKTIILVCCAIVLCYTQGGGSVVDDFLRFSRRTIEPVLVKMSDFNPITTFQRLLPTVPSVSHHLFEAYVILPLRNIAYDCAYEDRVNEFWRNEYDNNPVFTQLAYRFWPQFMDVPTRPSRDFVTYKCKLAYHFVGKPFIPDFRPVTGYLIIKNIVVYGSAVICLLCSSIVTTICVLVARRRRIYIVNPNRAVDFDTDMDPLRRLLKKNSKSVQTMFATCVAHVTSSVSKIRIIDLAGCCPTEYVNDTHVCSIHLSRPTNNYDVDHCKVDAYNCPQKAALPFTIINCSDHAFTQTQLCDIVTGPTLIVSPYSNGGACSVQRVEDRVRITAGNGHSVDGHLHPWTKAGVVMGLTMAFEYQTIFSNEHVHIIFCVPAHGIYSRDSAETMPLPKSSQLPVIDGYSVTQTTADYVFSDGTDEFTVSIAFVEQVAMSLSPVARDEKYPQTAMSYITAQAKSHELSTQKLAITSRLICYFSDLYALNCVSNNTVLIGRPGDFNLRSRVSGRIRLWANKIAPSWARRHLIQLFGRRWIEPAVRWTFPVVYVPTYEVHSRINKCLRLFGMATRHIIDRFPPAPTNANARVDDEDHSSAGENSFEHDNVTGNAGAESGCSTPPFFDEQPGTPTCGSGDEGFHDPTPPRPKDPERKPQTPKDPDAKGCEEPNRNQSRAHNQRDNGRTPQRRSRDRTCSSSRSDPFSGLHSGESGPKNDPVPPYFGASTWEDFDSKKLVLITHFVDQTDSKVVLDEDLSGMFYDATKTEAEAAAVWLDEVRNNIRKVDPRFGTDAQIKLLLRFAVDPHAFEAGRLLKFDGGDLLLGGDDAAHRDRTPTVELRGLGSSLSYNKAEPAPGGSQPCPDARVGHKRPTNKKFSKDRNERQRHRSKKH